MGNTTKCISLHCNTTKTKFIIPLWFSQQYSVTKTTFPEMSMQKPHLGSVRECKHN